MASCEETEYPSHGQRLTTQSFFPLSSYNSYSFCNRETDGEVASPIVDTFLRAIDNVNGRNYELGRAKSSHGYELPLQSGIQDDNEYASRSKICSF